MKFNLKLFCVYELEHCMWGRSFNYLTRLQQAGISAFSFFLRSRQLLLLCCYLSFMPFFFFIIFRVSLYLPLHVSFANENNPFWPRVVLLCSCLMVYENNSAYHIARHLFMPHFFHKLEWEKNYYHFKLKISIYARGHKNKHSFAYSRGLFVSCVICFQFNDD